MSIPIRRALSAILLALLGVVFAIQGYRVTLDAREVLVEQLLALGWEPSSYRVQYGSTEPYYLSVTANGRIESLRPDQPGTLEIRMSKPSPLDDWVLDSFGPVESPGG